MEHTLELVHNGRRRFGLLSGSVTISLEQIAPTFEFTYAERIRPSDPLSIIYAGELVSLLVDGEPLVEGYVNTSSRKHRADTLEYSVRGRGAAQDLVDCSHIGEMHFGSASVDAIVGKLVKPFGYTVRMAQGASPGAPLQGFKIDKGEKVFDAVMRACTRRGLWPRALPVGYTIELMRISATPESTPLVNGENCLEMEFEENDEQLYSAYFIHGRTSETDDAYGDATRIRGEVDDPTVQRYRPLRIDTRGGDGPSDPGLRAKMERNRRLGNSEVIKTIARGWRDYDGKLWLPNQLRVCVDLTPEMQLNGPEMLITTARYEWDETIGKGFVCPLELKRREAFDPEASFPRTQAGARVQ